MFCAKLWVWASPLSRIRAAHSLPGILQVPLLGSPGGSPVEWVLRKKLLCAVMVLDRQEKTHPSGCGSPFHFVSLLPPPPPRSRADILIPGGAFGHNTQEGAGLRRGVALQGEGRVHGCPCWERGCKAGCKALPPPPTLPGVRVLSASCPPEASTPRAISSPHSCLGKQAWPSRSAVSGGGPLCWWREPCEPRSRSRAGRM